MVLAAWCCSRLPRGHRAAFPAETHHSAGRSPQQAGVIELAFSRGLDKISAWRPFQPTWDCDFYEFLWIPFVKKASIALVLLDINAISTDRPLVTYLPLIVWAQWCSGHTAELFISYSFVGGLTKWFVKLKRLSAGLIDWLIGLLFHLFALIWLDGYCYGIFQLNQHA